MSSTPLTSEYLNAQLEEVLRAVKEGFDGTATKTDLERVETKVDDLAVSTRAELRRIEAVMVTKSYLDDKLADLKGDLIVKLRKEDEKVEFLIALPCARKSLSEEDRRRIQTEYQIFPSIP
jgi:hypothetical protein